VTDSDPQEASQAAAVLEDRTAGGKVIRGGALRTFGYFAGVGLAAVASVFLLRYLGVVDFGRYVVVMSVVAVVGGITDVGLTIVGQREYAVARSEADRRRLLANMAGLRLAVTPAGVLLGALFGIVAGYGSVLVTGVLLAGAGLVFANMGSTYTVPLTVGLRFGAVTIAELVRQVAIVLGIGVAVASGAALTPFFLVHIFAGVAGLVVAVALVGLRSTPGPSFDFGVWWFLLREAAPIAVATIVNVVYVRVLVIMTSLIATGTETGLFATSYRIVEVFIGVPALMVGAAFPLLAHAGATDRERLAYGLQRVGEVALLVSLGLALLLAFAAEPIVAVLGGEEYEDAAPLLSVQAFALVGAFLTQVWSLGLVSIRRQRELILVNGIGLVTVLVLGLTLIPPLEGEGAAIAATAGELVLAVSVLIMLARADPALRPNLAYVPKLVTAAALGAGLALVLDPPPIAGALLAFGVYALAALAMRAVPAEIWQALRQRA